MNLVRYLPYRTYKNCINFVIINLETIKFVTKPSHCLQHKRKKGENRKNTYIQTIQPKLTVALALQNKKLRALRKRQRFKIKKPNRKKISLKRQCFSALALKLLSSATTVVTIPKYTSTSAVASNIRYFISNKLVRMSSNKYCIQDVTDDRSNIVSISILIDMSLNFRSGSWSTST